MNWTRYNISLLLANVLFAINYSIFVSLLSTELNFKQIFLLQLIMSTFILLPCAMLQRNFYRIKPCDLGIIALTSLISNFGWNYTTLWGVSLTSPVDVATLATAGPALTLVIAHILGRQQLTRPRLFGALLSLVVVLTLLLHRGRILIYGSEGFGNMLIVIAVVAAAVNTLIIKPQLERYGTTSVLGWYSLVGLLSALAFIGGEFKTLAIHPNLELIYLLVVGSVAPLYMLFRGAEKLTPLHTSLYRYIQPLITSIIVVARSQATLKPINYLAIALIAISALLMSRNITKEQVPK